MSFQFNTSNPQSEVTTLTGHIVVLEQLYSAAEKSAVTVLVAASGISLLSVVGLLCVLGFSAYKTMRAPSVHRFMRTHVVAYFISLLLCDVISTVGSLMNAQWISEGGVHLGNFCTSQGALKNTGNVGTALWTLVISIHTFCLLVLKWRSNDYVLYGTLFVVWAFIGLVVIIGPAAVQNVTDKGPYFGVSGYWCWITDGYAAERIALEYFWMFFSAFVSLVLYSMVFLSLRGNLIVSGGNMRFRIKRSTATRELHTGRDSSDAQSMGLAKHMLAYPIAYTALILPISICRFLEWADHDIPFAVTIFADTLFMLSGLTNVVLFATTRKIIPARATARALFSRSKASTFDLESQKSVSSIAPMITPYIREKAAYVPTRPPVPAPPVVPFKAEPQSAEIPLSVPVPALQDPRPGKMIIPKRGASLAPPSVAVVDRKTGRETTAPPKRTSVGQSAITPLQIVKKASIIRKPVALEPVVHEPVVHEHIVLSPTQENSEPEEDIGERNSWSDRTSSRYSASSYCSSVPLDPSPPPLPTPHKSHHRHRSSSTSSRYNAV